MFLAQVVGKVVCTVKDRNLGGKALLLCRSLQRLDGEQLNEGLLVAVDVVGAGEGSTVLLCQGSPALASTGVPSGVDLAAVGLVDHISAGEEKHSYNR